MKKNLHLILIITLLISSCTVQKEIERADAINRQIQSLRDLNGDKVGDGTMSPEIGARIDSSYEKMQTNINNKKEELIEARNKKDLVTAKRIQKELKAISVSYQRTIEVFLELYKGKATLKTFESSRFFASGEYEIRPEDATLVLADMDPIIKSLNDKIESDPNLHIKVVLGVYGYTDEQPISSNKPLYQELKRELGVSNPTQEQLNQKLSEFRARELSKLLRSAIDKRKNDNVSKDSVIFEISWLGRGYSKLPFKGMEHKKDDPKRRVVTVIWGLIPILKD